MSSKIIRVSNVSKQYRLGQVGTGSFHHDVNRWWHKVRGKEDPYLMIGEMNDREKKGSSDYVWALRDLNFEVEAGEVLGIIGRNGAGKSTLLKILSRTTTPTTGQVKMRGRVASLLEVGTGFHPDLTGRENIYLNGAILGMRRHEITAKFDEIVDFAGVERYIDTPVKRYSSGMYVRLAFAVAAHLEPEILIVDEVLAVGDAEFQKKCLGKMKDVSTNDGRTVLFVSHSMPAIKNLCTKALLLGQGKIENIGAVNDIIGTYFNNKISKIWVRESKGNSAVFFAKASVEVAGHQPELSLSIIALLHVTKPFLRSFVAVDIADESEQPLMQAIPREYPFIDYTDGQISFSIKVSIKLPPIIPGKYKVSLWIGSHYFDTYDYLKYIMEFEVTAFPVLSRTIPYPQHCGFLVPDSSVEFLS